MGDMAEIFREMKQESKERRARRESNNIPILESIGAVEKSMGVWQHNEWFIYPTKGFVMNKYDTSIRMSINKYVENYT